MKINTFLSILCFCIMLFSCQENKRENHARKIVNEWIGKEIKFPEDIYCQLVEKENPCIDYMNNNTYKVIAYTDSSGCTSCRLKLSDWKQIMAEADSLFPGKLDFLFFFQPKTTEADMNELAFLLQRDHFNYPVFIDIENRIHQMNHFPPEMEYQCFLLDPNNKVMSVGNPTLNPNVWDLYKQQITGNNAANSLLKQPIIYYRKSKITGKNWWRDYVCMKSLSFNCPPPFFPLYTIASLSMLKHAISPGIGSTSG